MTEPPFSQSADRNKDVILEQLRVHLPNRAHILEIASGTGQHALHFAKSQSGWTWQTSDRDLTEYGLVGTIADVSLPNLPPPIELDVTQGAQNLASFDVVYSSNCIHVMPLENLDPYIAGAASVLRPNGLMMLYGPFRYGGAFTSESNGEFDSFLKQRYPGGGIRDFEMVDALAQQNGLVLVHDAPMPANNQFIVWRKWVGGA